MNRKGWGDAFGPRKPNVGRMRRLRIVLDWRSGVAERLNVGVVRMVKSGFEPGGREMGIGGRLSLATGLVAMSVLVCERSAIAQSAGRGPESASPGAGAGMETTSGMNPYTNPAFNPYLNPWMTQVGPVGRTDALLYLLAAQQQPGGALDPNRGNGRRGATVSRPNLPNPYMVSGAGAANYFGRGQRPAAGRQPNRYQRYGRHYGFNDR